MTIHDDLAKAAAEVGAVKKTGVNQHQRFNFRGVDAVMTAVGPKLHKHGVVGPIPELLEEKRDQIGASRNGAPITRVVVKVKYTLYGKEGDSLQGVVVAEANDTADKATAKAMSVAIRTFLLQALCLPTDDPDPDEDYIESTPEGAARAACNQLVQDWAAQHGGNPSELAARYQADGGTADPARLKNWLQQKAGTP